MLWRGRRQSDNVEDLGAAVAAWVVASAADPGACESPSAGTGGGGLSGILILVVLFFALKACGIDPMAVLTGEDPTMGREEGGGTVTQQGQSAGSDEMKQFVSYGAGRDRRRVERHLPGRGPDNTRSRRS